MLQGVWRAPLIKNPNYKGKWKPRRIPNPDYFKDETPFRMTPIVSIRFLQIFGRLTLVITVYKLTKLCPM